MQENSKEIFLFAPVADVPYPRVNLADTTDPIRAIVEAPQFIETTRFFTQAPSSTRSLLSSTSQALLYSVIRNLRPDHVVEIGTYQGGTAEALSRALEANGHGTLHTVSPFDPGDRFGQAFPQWPDVLRRRTIYYPVDSMSFFMQMAEQRIRPGVVLVDGNHDFEFAAFDIWSAARHIVPGGFIFADNISQAGPYRAGVEFLAANPEWRDCGWPPTAHDDTKAFDRLRSRVRGTDFYVLRAPFGYFVAGKPKTFGEIGWHSLDLGGLTITPASRNQVGTLKVQCILRAFSTERIVEIVTDTECRLDGRMDPVQVKLERTWQVEEGFPRHTVEPWLCWSGNEPLELKSTPTLF